MSGADCGFDELHVAHLYVVAVDDRPVDRVCPGYAPVTYTVRQAFLRWWVPGVITGASIVGLVLWFLR